VKALNIKKLEKEIDQILKSKNRGSLAELRGLTGVRRLNEFKEVKPGVLKEVKTYPVYDRKLQPAIDILDEWDSLTMQEENMSAPEHCFSIGRVYNKFEALKKAKQSDPLLDEIRTKATKTWEEALFHKTSTETLFDVLYQRLTLATGLSEAAKDKLKGYDKKTWPQLCSQWGLRERDYKKKTGDKLNL
jgi:hypothetical protein